MKFWKVRLGHKVLRQVRVVAMVAGLHSSQSHLRKKRACLVLCLYCNILNQRVHTEQPDTQDGGEKARSHSISVLASTVINRQSIEQCTYLRRAPLSQCVCQQIASVYFPWRLSPTLYPACFISCPPWLHWCVSVVTSGVPSVSDTQKAEGEPMSPLTPDPVWPLVN